jgi:uracil-DNA glycosylase
MPRTFYGTSGPHTAKIVAIGESWGDEEARKLLPFVGRTGFELDKILPECGIARPSIFLSNVVSEHPFNNDMWRFFYPTKQAREEGRELVRGLYPMPNVMEGVEMLRAQLKEIQPEVIIGFGNYTLWALTDDSFSIGDLKGHKVPTGITDRRGSQLYCREDMGGFKFMPTYHPASIFHQWPWRYDIVHDLKSRMPKALRGEWDTPKYNFIIRPSFGQVLTTLQDLYTQAITLNHELLLSVDIENSEYITCIGFAWSELDAICIPFVANRFMEPYWSVSEEIVIIESIRALLSHTNVHIIGQNFLHDAQYIALQFGVIPICKSDTQLLQHVLWPGKRKSLNYNSSLYNHYHSYWKDEGREWHKTFSEDQHWTYNCKDTVITMEVARHQRALIKQFGIEEQADLQMSQFPLCLEMMLRGVNIDLEAKADLSIDLAAAVDVRQKYLDKMIPDSVFPRDPKKSPWYTSPLQQAELFYDYMGVKEIISLKTKSRTCDDDALMKIAERETILRPIIQTLQELRSAKIFKKNFVDMRLDPDNRVRCMFDPSGTDTFRWNSRKSVHGSGANLQTIPKGTEDE